MNTLLDTTGAPLGSLITQSHSVLNNADSVIGQLNTVTKRLDGLTKKLQSKDNTAGLLLNDRALHDDLVKTVHSADSLFQIILKDGLDVNVDFF